jgi:hypothetical protein
MTLAGNTAIAKSSSSHPASLDASLQPIFAESWRFYPENSRKVQALVPYESIALNVINGMSNLKPYSIVLHRSGDATLAERKDDGSYAHFKGEFSVLFYARLAQLVERIGFMNYSPVYARSASDDNEATITVTEKNKTKSVTEDMNLEGSGPVGLWALRTLIDRERIDIRWQPTDGE